MKIRHPSLSSRKLSRGFTLIELMIAVAIVSILTAVAIPAYSSYVQKARRTDAKNAILDFAARQERYYSVNNQYATTAANLGYGGAFPVSVQTSGSTAYYTLNEAVVAGTATTGPTYTVTVAPIAGQAQATDACGSYVLTNLGVQSNTGNSLATAKCW
jgi:type IV pilus assembly protein PilE